MLTKEIEYKDYNGKERKESFLFDLSEAELIELDLTTPGGFEKYLNSVVAAENVPELFRLFKMLILKAYGKKSDDGRRFIKSDSISEEFTQTPAYSVLLMELMSDVSATEAFIKGLMPGVPNNENLKAVPNVTDTAEVVTK